jgi:hypothetical protein
VIDCGGYPFPTAGNGQCGLKIESDSTGAAILIESCQFGGGGIKSNGYVAESYDMYDLYIPVTTGSGGTIRGCRFGSPIVAVGAGVGVQYSVGDESDSLDRYELNEFGSGSNNYLNAPTHVLAAP